jgi:hypothetical protein
LTAQDGHERIGEAKIYGLRGRDHSRAVPKFAGQSELGGEFTNLLGQYNPGLISERRTMTVVRQSKLAIRQGDFIRLQSAKGSLKNKSRF